MEISQIINLLLSSAVVAAIINVIIQNKNNKLHYITNERSEWRKNVREIMINIQKAGDKKTLEKHFISLKTYLNYYGKRYNGYRDNIVTDIEKDEHIWKLLDEIERETEFDKEKKNQLVDLLGFLLKFDWERAKREVKNNYGIIVSTVLYVLGSVGMLFAISALRENGDTKFSLHNIWYLLLQLLCYAIILLPYISAKMKLLRTVNWFGNTKLFTICCVLGESMCFVLDSVVWLNIIVKSTEAIWIYYFKIVVNILSFIGVLLCLIDERSLYLDYSNQIRNCLGEKPIYMYYHKDGFKIMCILQGLEGRTLSHQFCNIRDKNFDFDAFCQRASLNKKQVKRRGQQGKDNRRSLLSLKKPKLKNVVVEYRGEYKVVCGAKELDLWLKQKEIHV